MYERMLDKSHQPTPEEFASHIGASVDLFYEFDRFMTEELNADKLMRFPYGKDYGWSYKYFVKSKHLCDLFAEAGAFNIMAKLTGAQAEAIKVNADNSTIDELNNMYPCGDGGWVHYRVDSDIRLRDAKMIMLERAKKSVTKK